MSQRVASRLTAADLAYHKALGIEADWLESAGVERLTDAAARERMGINGKAGNYEGVWYPYPHPQTGRRTTSRLRLDHPPLKPDGTPDKKYLAPFGDVRHAFFPPGAGALLPDVSVPILFVEAEKSALASAAAAKRTSRRVVPIALGGCWNFRGRIGKDVDAKGARVDVVGPLPDLRQIPWQNRTAIICYDSRPNDSVRAARREFSRMLRAWGADVRHAHLPDGEARVNGPDDFIGLYGDASFWQVIDAAQPEDFTRDDEARIAPGSLDNVRLALSKLTIRPEYDAFAREIVIAGSPADDVAIDRLWVGIDDAFHFRPSKETLRTVLTTEAHDAAFHPVRQYLDRLVWDGEPRIDQWLVLYGGANDSAYVRAVGALALIAAVTRIRQPGAKYDELLILEGRQGTLKSSALRALCPDEGWFSDDLPLGVDSKQVIERTSGRWIIEASELHGNRGREAEQLKAFLSRQVDGPVRLAYGRLPVTVPRQFILIGTTNSSLAYLKDSTGARRFWPVKIGAFDVTAITLDRDQLWAEAAARQAAGESIRLSPDLWDAASLEQEDRRASDPWEEILAPLLEDALHVPVEAIWNALKLEASHLDNRHADRVAAIVQRHGLTTKGKVRIDRKPVTCWKREETC